LAKSRDATEAKSLREECNRLKEKVLELQRDNSANQAKLLMSAFGGSGAPLGLGLHSESSSASTSAAR